MRAGFGRDGHLPDMAMVTPDSALTRDSLARGLRADLRSPTPKFDSKGSPPRPLGVCSHLAANVRCFPSARLVLCQMLPASETHTLLAASKWYVPAPPSLFAVHAHKHVCLLPNVCASLVLSVCEIAACLLSCVL